MAGFVNNQLYNILIDAGITAEDGSAMGTDYEFRFVSVLYPFVGNPTYIYQKIIPYASEKTIVDVYSYLAQVINTLNVDLGEFSAIIELGVGEDYNNLICYINNSIIADLLDDGYISTMGAGVTLGDLTIREPHYNTGAGPLIEKYRTEALMCLTALGLHSTVTSMTKGGAKTLPPGIGANRTWPHTGYPDYQRKYPYRRTRY